MLFTAFPNLEWLRQQANSGFASGRAADGTHLPHTGWPNVIMNAKANETVRDNIRGPLSIFANLSGTSWVSVAGKNVRVTAENFFITNAGQHYTLEIHEKAPTETLNIHFGDRFAEKALGSLAVSPEACLENKDAAGSTDFYNCLIPATEEFTSILSALKTNTLNHNLFEEEKLFQLLNLLVKDQKNIHSMQERLDAAKPATKTEILKRLLTAIDFLYSHPEKMPDLDELARISCLSKFHFLRLFKAAYHQTPYQFLTALKIKRAKELLQESPIEINSIAEKLGFDNASSFSRLFRNQTGFYPSQFRAIA